jgi:hypothetical protein
MRPFPLADQVEGINLARSKGGASPRSLFDLKNAWITPQRTINGRPGSVKDLSFPAGTKGVVGFDDLFNTFAAVPTVSTDPRVVVHVLRHPTGGAAGLLKIHRAFPFLGRLYVVAEFTDGVVKHYWLDAPYTWSALRTVSFGYRLQPTVENGYYYANRTQNTTPAWTANTTVTVGTFRQPTTINGLMYEVTAVTGTAPIKTSNTQPTWPTTVGATVVERRYTTDPQNDPGDPGPPNPPGGGAGDGDGSVFDEYGPFRPRQQD